MPADVVQAIHYLVEAEYVTGTVLQVDGGRHLRR
jgi:NAD(P)-dependent dehydrogenase (short-subunit alcohol dehydrogenase family)